MKAIVYKLNGERKTQIELPIQFKEPVRFDLIRKVISILQSHRRQPYGADPEAGTRQGYATPKRRRKYKTTYGYGISRIKRKHLWHRGGRFGWVGAFVANAVGGRKAFPPKAEKKWAKKINKKERRKSIRSALAAIVPNILILEDKLESLKKAKDVANLLKKFNLKAGEKKIRAGKGKRRGRKYRISKGPLFVVSKPCELEKAAKNFLGVDVVQVQNLNTELLIPGGNLLRKTIWSESAIKKLEKERLFL